MTVRPGDPRSSSHVFDAGCNLVCMYVLLVRACIGACAHVSVPLFRQQIFPGTSEAPGPFFRNVPGVPLAFLAFLQTALRASGGTSRLPPDAPKGPQYTYNMPLRSLPRGFSRDSNKLLSVRGLPGASVLLLLSGCSAVTTTTTTTANPNHEIRTICAQTPPGAHPTQLLAPDRALAFPRPDEEEEEEEAEEEVHNGFSLFSSPTRSFRALEPSEIDLGYKKFCQD